MANFNVLESICVIDENLGEAYFASPVMSALTFMHGKGILYRDMKTQNFLVDKKGTLSSLISVQRKKKKM